MLAAVALGALLPAPLLCAAAHGQGWLEWGDESCWAWPRIFEVCCYPNPKDVGVTTSVIVEEGWSHCWEGDLNVSRCCRPHGRFLAGPRHGAPLALRKAFDGCQGTGWQAFLFKFRIAAGTLSFFCQSIACWFEYWGLQLSGRWTSLLRPDVCPVGYALRAVAEEFGGRRLLGDGERLMNLTAGVRRLERLARTLVSTDGVTDLFFKAVGVTTSQLKYLEYLTGLRVPETLPPEAEDEPLSQALRHASGQSWAKAPLGNAPLVLDFGMSRGADAEFYLLSGYRVVAVEANARFAEEASRRLRSFVESGRLSVVHAAVGGDTADGGAEEAVDFYVDHHHAEKSGMLVDGRSVPEGDVTRTVVPRRSCGAVYAAATEGRPRLPPLFGRAEYAKIDIEGEDVACLQSLLALGECGAGGCREESRPPGAPLYVSLELGVLNDMKMGQMLNIAAVQALEVQLHSLLKGRYCGAKLCRQAVYNSRVVRGHSGLSMPMSRAGLGSSGPFGDAAADWRSGSAWRSLDEVLRELSYAAQLVHRAPGEWFDLHLWHCPP